MGWSSLNRSARSRAAGSPRRLARLARCPADNGDAAKRHTAGNRTLWPPLGRSARPCFCPAATGVPTTPTSWLGNSAPYSCAPTHGRPCRPCLQRHHKASIRLHHQSAARSGSSACQQGRAKHIDRPSVSKPMHIDHPSVSKPERMDHPSVSKPE
eukprot:134518-Chlamydomonas_euryale.AAC.1